MSSTDELGKLFDSIRKGFNIGIGDIILPTDFGPITLDTLPFLEGWRWRLDPVGYPGDEIQLVAGGPAVPLVNWTDEKGWAISMLAVFRSPYAIFNMEVDDWKFSVSPFILQTLGSVQPTNVSVWNTVYNPATPFGPLYSVMLEGAYAFPYHRRVYITMSLPAASPIPQTTVFTAFAGKIWIQDEKIFLRSIKRHTLEQMTGNKIERYP